jgi:hypothetical protein
MVFTSLVMPRTRPSSFGMSGRRCSRQPPTTLPGSGPEYDDGITDGKAIQVSEDDRYKHDTTLGQTCCCCVALFSCVRASIFALLSRLGRASLILCRCYECQQQHGKVPGGNFTQQDESSTCCPAAQLLGCCGKSLGTRMSRAVGTSFCYYLC